MGPAIEAGFTEGGCQWQGDARIPGDRRIRAEAGTVQRRTLGQLWEMTTQPHSGEGAKEEAAGFVERQ